MGAFHEFQIQYISRNRPYIGGHLAFYFKLNSKLFHKILKIVYAVIFTAIQLSNVCENQGKNTTASNY